MKTSLENVSRKFYAFLDEHDLRVLREYPDSSGRFIVEAELPEFRMRFVKERGTFLLQVGSLGLHDWQDLHNVVEAATKKSVPNDPEVLTEYLLSDYAGISLALGALDSGKASSM